MYPYIKPSDALSLRCAWREVPGRNRFTFDRRRGAHSIFFPTTVFCTSYLDGFDTPPTSCGVLLDATIMGDTLIECGRNCSLVCFGPDAARLIRRGELDPVEAFWMTGKLDDYTNHLRPMYSPRDKLLRDAEPIPRRYFTSGN